MKAIRWLLILYAILCGLALALIPISKSGWFGGDGDGLAAIYAILLAMPWSMMVGGFGVSSPWVAVPLLVGVMLANGAIILGIATLLSAARRG